MANASRLLSSTVEVCNSLNFTEISNDWADNLYAEDFCDIDGLPDFLRDDALRQKYYADELFQFVEILRKWTQRSESNNVQQANPQGKGYFWMFKAL